jgi:hypothetical protein
MKRPWLVRACILAAFVLSFSSTLQAVEEMVELSLQKSKALSGIVVYPNGDPVIGAHVVEYSPDWKSELRRTETDLEGHFTLAPVKGRKIYYLQITARERGVNTLRAPVQISRLRGRGSLHLCLKLA